MSISGSPACCRSAAPMATYRLVTEKSIPIRNMALQYNFVFDRAGDRAAIQQSELGAIRQHAWSRRPAEGELANGTYRPILAPVNFADSDKGNALRDRLVCWPALDPQHARPLPVHPEQPAELQGGEDRADRRRAGRSRFARSSRATSQFTVNGQFQPVIDAQARPDRDLGARECERHGLHHRPAHRDGDRAAIRRSRIVAQDGNREPAGAPSRSIPIRHAAQAFRRRRRYAIAVTMPETRRARSSRCRSAAAAHARRTRPGVLYTSDGTRQSAGGARHAERAAFGGELL